jgi:hypothetical protein
VQTNLPKIGHLSKHQTVKRLTLQLMLTEKEKQFLRYWEANKDIENTFLRKLLGGLPMAVIFGLPVILSVVVVRLFFPDWYMKISETTPGMFISAIIAVVCIVLF